MMITRIAGIGRWLWGALVVAATLPGAAGVAWAEAAVRDVAEEVLDRVEEVIRPSDMRHEEGAGYTARLSGGRPGDKDSPGSQCVLLEDGRPLPIPRALHADIRAMGGGRYSHWTAGTLYFSASDNSDPRTNGKSYTLAGQARVLRHRTTARLTGPVNNHRIEALSDREIVNHRVTLRNRDARTAVVPRLAMEGWPDLSSSEGILRSILRPEMTDEEKTLAIWRFLIDWRYHYYPAEGGAEVHDPVKFINVYGYGFCDDSAHNAAALARMAGLRSRIWGLDGHVVAETFFDGRWHMIDPDHEVYYRASAGHIASVEELAADPAIITRTPRDPIGSDARSIARLYTTTENNRASESIVTPGHRLDLRLEPGDEVVFDLRDRTRFHAIAFPAEGRPPSFANGRLTRTMATGGGAEPVRVEWPYVILGGRLRWTAAAGGDDDGTKSAGVGVSLDGKKFTTLEVAADGDVRTVDLDGWIASLGGACYGFRLRVPGGGRPVRLELDFQFAPRALAQVRAGVNRFQCHIATPDGTPLPDSWEGLEVIHEWQESLEAER